MCVSEVRVTIIQKHFALHQSPLSITLHAHRRALSSVFTLTPPERVRYLSLLLLFSMYDTRSL